MNNRIRDILQQIRALEDELRVSLREQKDHIRYQVDGKRIAFERAAKDAHRRMKIGVFRWLLSVRPQNFLTMPFIYGLIVPLLLVDLCVSFYQATCFPIYRIPKARRSDYMVFDHQHLAYLNIIEKFHCLYCSYATGLLAYVREIAARTEQYFCPIKHAHKILGTEARYRDYLEYGEGENFHARLEEVRESLAKENETGMAQGKDKAQSL